MLTEPERKFYTFDSIFTAKALNGMSWKPNCFPKKVLRPFVLNGRRSFLFIVFILLNTGNLFAQFIPATQPPSYSWKDYKDLPTVFVSLTGANTEDLTIAIATDSQGNVYTLSFGNGVDKRDANGNIIQSGFIPSGQLDNPLDIAIDEDGYIYIADFLAGGQYL